MDRHRFVGWVTIAGLLLVSLAGPAASVRAASTSSSERVNRWQATGYTADGRNTLPARAGLTEAPRLVPPRALPPQGPQLQAAPILTITKSAVPSPVDAGEMLTYTLVIANGGTANATGAVISDTLDSNVSFAAASDAGVHSTGVVTWSVGVIPIGQMITRTLWVTVSQVASGTILSNTARVTSLEGANATHTLTTPVTTAADLAVSKSDSVDPAIAGTSFTYIIRVTNHGPSHASGVTLTDTLPTGLSFNAAGSSAQCLAAGQAVTCTIGNLSATAVATRTIAVTAAVSLPDGTQLANTAAAKGNQPDPIPGNDSDQETTTIRRRADLAVTKEGTPSPVRQGDNLTYTIVVTNHGPSNASGVTITDTLPGGVSLVSATPSQGSACTGTTTVTCKLDALNKDANALVTIVVNVSRSAPELLSNSVSVHGVETDLQPGNNLAGEDTPVTKRTWIYLPIIFKPPPTILSVHNDNTRAQVIFIVRDEASGAEVTRCTVPNNATLPCDHDGDGSNVFPPGIYSVQVTSACGPPATFTKAYDSGPQTTRVFCK